MFTIVEATVINREKIISILQSTNREGIDKLIEYLCESDYFTAPASSRFHNNFQGGLADHSLKVTYILEKIVGLFKRNIPKESIYISGLLHDLCKVNYYVEGERNVKEDNKWKTVPYYKIEDQEPLGHSIKSLIIISRYIKLTALETYSILWHMGIPSLQSDLSSYNQSVLKYPDLILLHIADLTSSTIYEQKI